MRYRAHGEPRRPDVQGVGDLRVHRDADCVGLRAPHPDGEARRVAGFHLRGGGEGLHPNAELRGLLLDRGRRGRVGWGGGGAWRTPTRARGLGWSSCSAIPWGSNCRFSSRSGISWGWATWWGSATSVGDFVGLGDLLGDFVGLGDLVGVAESVELGDEDTLCDALTVMLRRPVPGGTGCRRRVAGRLHGQRGQNCALRY